MLKKIVCWPLKSQLICALFSAAVAIRYHESKRHLLTSSHVNKKVKPEKRLEIVLKVLILFSINWTDWTHNARGNGAACNLAWHRGPRSTGKIFTFINNMRYQYHIELQTDSCQQDAVIVYECLHHQAAARRPTLGLSIAWEKNHRRRSKQPANHAQTFSGGCKSLYHWLPVHESTDV